jgi:hypothetical protein
MAMKKYFLIAVVLILSFSEANAQAFAFGIKAGANINKLSGEAFSQQFSYGYHAGVFATVGLGKHWAVQAEGLFSQVNIDTASNAKSIYNPSNQQLSQINLSYLSIPVLLQYKLSKGISLEAGPQYSILLNKQSSLLQNGQDAFKEGDFSVLGGLEIKISSLRIYGRYAIGLTSINNIGDQSEWKSQSIQVGLGLSLL